MSRIALCGDSRFRDSISLAFVRKQLVDLGHDARVISFQIASQAIPIFNPDILVLNHLFGRRNQDLARYVKRLGGKVVIMPTEGRPDTGVQLKWVAKQAEMQDLYDLYLSWNEQVAEVIPKSVVTGCPRFDVYRPDYNYLIEDKETVLAKYGLIGKAKVIGITTAFPSAKFAYTNRQFHKRDWKDLMIDDDPFALANGEYLQAQKFKNLIQYTRLEFPDYEFVLKPHPMADRHMWQSFCEDSNIVLSPPDYIHNFLQVCDILIARVGCSTVQDAWMMHKPVIQVDLPPIRDAEFDGAARDAMIGDVALSPDELSQFVSYAYYLGDGYWDKADDYLSRYGYKSNLPSSKQVTLEIHKLAHDVSTNGALTFDNEVMLNRLQVELAKNTIYPSPAELHTAKHIPEQVVWSKELDLI